MIARSTVLFLILGLTLASGVIAVIEISPVDIYFAKRGTLMVKVADLPCVGPKGICNVTSLTITIDGMRVHRSGFANLTGAWIDIPLREGNATFDLVELRDATREIGVASLPEGKYTQIRMQVVEAVAEFEELGPKVLTVPSGELKIPINAGSAAHHFVIGEGRTTIVIVDLRVPNIKLPPQEQGILTPVVKVTVQGPE